MEWCKNGGELGADVPFLITGGLARVGGIGERIQPLLPAPQVWLVLVQPCEGLSTREVFSAFDRMDASSLRHPDNAAAQDALLRCDLTALAPAMANVLQAVSESARPALAQAVRALEAAEAARAMMTGSGSVVYGAFERCADAVAAQAAMEALSAQHGWGRVWLARTLPRGEKSVAIT